MKKKVCIIIVSIIGTIITLYFSYAFFVSIKVNSIIGSAQHLEEYADSVNPFISKEDYSRLFPEYTSVGRTHSESELKYVNNFKMIYPFFTSSIIVWYRYDLVKDYEITVEVLESQELVKIHFDYSSFPFRICKVELWGG